MSELNIPLLSVLDLVPIRQGQEPKEAIESMVLLAQATEKLGYQRYWIAEHHNMPSVISSATAILIKHALENTKTIRVGAGGIMLPNHSPLVVAEQFGTLSIMYPDRVDLGLGRAPGTDSLTSQALRRSRNESIYSFPNDVRDLTTYFGPEDQQGRVKAFPGVGTNVPVYVLGSSTSSAILAADLGLPYSFAGHFAPAQMQEAVELYRARFKPSQFLLKPYVILGMNVLAAETNEEAEIEFSTMIQLFLNTMTGKNTPVPPPVQNLDNLISTEEQQIIKSQMGIIIKGDKESIKSQLIEFQSMYHADELMVNSYIFDQKKQIRSYDILKEAIASI